MAAWAARNAADQRSLRQRSSFQPNSLEDASPTSTRCAATAGCGVAAGGAALSAMREL